VAIGVVPEMGAKPDDIYVTNKTWNAFFRG
jgi:hypothetical protein